MTVFATGVLGVLGGFLIVSAVSKAVRADLAIAALADFGLPSRLAHVVVAASVAIETAVGAALVLRPHALEARVAYLSLFAVFAALGLLAVQRGRVVECGCFGMLHRSTLGWGQILQFALAVPAVIVVGRFAPAWSWQRGFGSLFVVQLAVGTLLLAYTGPVWWRIRRDRVSLAAARVMARQLGWKSVVPDGEVSR